MPPVHTACSRVLGIVLAISIYGLALCIMIAVSTWKDLNKTASRAMFWMSWIGFVVGWIYIPTMFWNALTYKPPGKSSSPYPDGAALQAYSMGTFGGH